MAALTREVLQSELQAFRMDLAQQLAVSISEEVARCLSGDAPDKVTHVMQKTVADHFDRAQSCHARVGSQHVLNFGSTVSNARFNEVILKGQNACLPSCATTEAIYPTRSFEDKLQTERYPSTSVMPSHSAVASGFVEEDASSEGSSQMPDDDTVAAEFEEQELLMRIPKRGVRKWSPSQATLLHLVEGHRFEYASALLVVLNAVALGVEADLHAQCARSGGAMPQFIHLSEAFFCVLFTAELFIRILAHGSSFFSGNDCAWNAFDALVVGMQILDQISMMVSELHAQTNLRVLRMVRIVRLVRITRLLRAIRLVEELRTIVSSIAGSMKALGWTLLLLSMTVYMFSVLFMEIIIDSGAAAKNPDMDHWYGRLCRTCLTLFECIVGGVSWEEAVDPLIKEISPLMAVLFCGYISFCVFAMLNMVTGVFVEKAMRTAAQDRDTYVANHITDLFFNKNGSRPITWEHFRNTLGSPDMQEYFKDIDVDVSEAWGLFQLLDGDNSGTIDPGEMVTGCLRLRGYAKALDLALVLHEANQIHQSMLDTHARIEQDVKSIHSALKIGRTSDVSKSRGASEGSPVLAHSSTRRVSFFKMNGKP